MNDIFLKNAYHSHIFKKCVSLIDKCFKTFLERLYLKRPQVLTAEKKTLTLVLPFLGELSLQTRTKLQKVFKRTLDCCKIQIVLKNQIHLLNVFRFKDCLPYDFVSCVVYIFQCGRCNASNYGETDKHLKVRSGEYISISPLTFKKLKPSSKSSIRDHLLLCNHYSSFDDYTIPAQGTNTFLLEIKESLLIKHDKAILNKNISSAPLFLFDNA